MYLHGSNKFLEEPSSAVAHVAGYLHFSLMNYTTDSGAVIPCSNPSFKASSCTQTSPFIVILILNLITHKVSLKDEVHGLCTHKHTDKKIRGKYHHLLH